MGICDGSVVVVSGIGPGLGRQLALTAAAEGARVVLGGRTEATLVETAAAVEDAGGQAAYAECDITSAQDCRGLVDTALDRFGRLDAVVNNAFWHGPMDAFLETGDLADWETAFSVNVVGSLRMVRAAVPALADTRGSVVFVGSQIVRRVRAGRGPYAASKAALLTAAQVLARELGPRGIRVNTVVPGRMWGPPLADHTRRRAEALGVSEEQARSEIVASLALPDIPTDAECARVAVFLASSLSGAMTGQAVDANGGETFH